MVLKVQLVNQSSTQEEMSTEGEDLSFLQEEILKQFKVNVLSPHSSPVRVMGPFTHLSIR